MNVLIPLRRRLEQAMIVMLTFGGTSLALWPKKAAGHEAWLLTPDEMARLAVAPIPSVFREIWPLSSFVACIALFSLIILVLAELYRKEEHRLFSPLATLAPSIGPLAIRQGIAVMLSLSALGGLPRHGTEMWSVPTLMVPDMQLVLAGGEWAWLAYAGFIIALCLFLGFLVRLSALALIITVGLGFSAFGFCILGLWPTFRGTSAAPPALWWWRPFAGHSYTVPQSTASRIWTSL